MTAFDPACLVCPHLLDLPAYQPILPVDILSHQLGLSSAQIVKLDANENPFGPLPQVLSALADLPYIHLYPDPESRLLRQALADHYGLPLENIMAGAGADELIDLLVRLLVEPGDTVLDCPPTFGMYAFAAGLNRANFISVPRRPDFSLDLPAIERAVQDWKPKLIFIASPNNPDGSLPDPEVVTRLLDLPLVVVLDEAYVDFAPPGSSWLAEVPRRSNLAVLRTFSKWAGLAGLRAGFGAFPTDLMDHLWKIKQPYNLSVAAAAAACVSLEHSDQLERNAQAIVAERRRLAEALQAIPWLEVYPSQANFVLCRVLGRDAARLKNDLARAGIFVRHFAKPGLQDHLRISAGRPEDTRALLEQLSLME